MSKDFDEINPDDIEGEPESRLLKWMSVVILLLAVGGFFALAWYAYHTGTTHEEYTQSQENLELVKADSSPIKEAPEDPGGQQFPHQDKTVFNAISGNEKPQVERILPTSEEPVEREKSETETWMNDRLAKKPDSTATAQPETKTEEAVTPESAKTEEEPNVPTTQFDPSSVRPVATEEPNTESGQADVRTAIPSVPATNVKEEVPVVDTPPAEKEVIVQKAEVKEEVRKEVKAEVKEVTKAEVTVPTGNKRVQLGAFKSQEEAEQQWNRIKGKIASKLGGREHRVIRVDLGAKGIFYRLHVMPFSSTPNAQSFCSSIAPQPCFVVTGK